MKTIVLEQPGRFTLTETPQPVAPGPGEALVRVLTVGIAARISTRSKARSLFSAYPRILGHELAVEVWNAARAPAISNPATAARSIHT